MPDIVHRIGIQASPEAIFEAVTEEEGLKGWWTKYTEAQPPAKGASLECRFPNTGPLMVIEEIDPPSHLVWRCTNGVGLWKDTTFHFDIVKEDSESDEAILTFAQRGYKEETPQLAHCNLKWGVFLLSLKSFCETGLGQPFPDDVKIESGDT